MKKIIAIVGLPGSGKSEAIQHLEKKYKLPKVYFGDVTFDEMKKRKLKINEKNERLVREDLRRKFGQDYYSKKVIEKISKIDKSQILVESLYSWPEYKGLKNKFGDNLIIIAIYASPKLRYNRLFKRKIRPLSAGECQSRDYAQIENLSQGSPIAMADFTIINEGSIKELEKNLDKVWRKIHAKKK